MDTGHNYEAADLKLHILSKGIAFEAGFLEHFAKDFSQMEKRRVYDDTDDPQLERVTRIPQEFYLGDVVVAVNYRQTSPWKLTYVKGKYRLLGKNGTDVRVTFPPRPRFFEKVTTGGIRCGNVANLYGGASLAFFTPSICYYFNDGHECKFCSLKSNRDSQHTFVSIITPSLAASVLAIALETDADVLTQIMLVGGNLSNYDKGFQKHLDIALALDEQQATLPDEHRLQTHLVTMPPRDFGMFDALKGLNVRITMNLEIFDTKQFEITCPGKARFYGRQPLMRALEYAVNSIGEKRVYSTLIAGLEPVDSTVTGINYLASIGVTPIVNVFHNDRGSGYEKHSCPTYEDLAIIAHAQQEVYQKYKLVPFWNGCGRNALDFEAKQGWFH